MKRPAPPKATKAELVREAQTLLALQDFPGERAVEWLLDQFTGWDLEAIIERLKNESSTHGNNETDTGKA